MPVCHEYDELISAYVDHELGEQEKLRVEDHVQGCRGCSHELESTIALKGRTRIAFSREPAPDNLWDGFRSRASIADNGNGSTRRRVGRLVRRAEWTFPRTIPAFGLGVLLIVMALVYTTNRPHMQCAEAMRLIPAYSVGLVSDATAMQVALHKGHCPECQRQYLDYLRKSHPKGEMTLDERLGVVPAPGEPGSPLYEKVQEPR